MKIGAEKAVFSFKAYMKVSPQFLHFLSVEIKRPTRCDRWFFIAKLIVRSTCFGHHYAHHQELKSIIQVVAACGTWCLVYRLSAWCGAVGCITYS
jgi:hypothetical protein